MKQVFTDKQTDEGEDIKKDKTGKPVEAKSAKKNAVQVFSLALNSSEYLKLLQFFTG